MSDEFLLTRDAAKILDITPHGVRAMTQRGALPCMRTPSGDRIFRKSDVEQVAKQRAAEKAKGGNHGR